MNISFDNATCATELLFHEFERIKDSVKSEKNAISEATPYILIPTSLLLLTLGHVIIRPSYAVIGFCVGAFSTIQVLHYMENVVPCHIALAATLAVGLSKAIASGFLIRASAVVLGIISGFIIAFSVFFAFPSLDSPSWADGPIIAGFRLFPTWTVATLVGLVFGILCYVKYKEVSIIITSTMGGYAFSFAIALLIPTVTSLTQMIIFASSTIFGVVCQHGIKYYRKYLKKKRQNKGSDKDNDETTTTHVDKLRYRCCC